jgi:hypothetical protein
MTRHRMIVSILVLVPVLLTATRSSALASPLLSGYGGPGQGSQAILGSALLNGPRGGGGSGAGPEGASGSSTSSSSITSRPRARPYTHPVDPPARIQSQNEAGLPSRP